MQELMQQMQPEPYPALNSPMMGRSITAHRAGPLTQLFNRSQEPSSWELT